MTRFNAFIPAFAALLLGGCVTAPSHIPTGYTYHDQEFKSANPPESMKVTQAQRKSMGPRQAQQFRSALYDLVDDLTERAGLPPKPVFVRPHEPMNAFFAQVDNDLREAMRHTGYTLAPSAAGAYAFTYDAVLIPQPKLDPEEYPDAVDTTSDNVEIILQVFDGSGEGASMLTEQRGKYRIDGSEHFFGVKMPAFLHDTARQD